MRNEDGASEARNIHEKQSLCIIKKETLIIF